MAKAKTLVLYHGTAHHFSGFNEASVGLGTEANAALGIHLTEYPAVAADYARAAGADAGSTVPHVLVVMVAVAKAMVVDSVDDFFGYENGEPVRAKTDFAGVRVRLRAAGFDAVAADDLGEGIGGTWIILDPAMIAITGRMSLAEAEEVNSASRYDGVEMICDQLFAEMDPGLPLRR